MSTWLGLTLIDWIVILIFLFSIAILGILAYGRVHDRSDFFLGGRRFGKVFMIFFSFASGTSSDDAMPVMAGTWRTGLAGIWWALLWLWSTPFYWIVAPVLRRMRALTTSDFFEARYDLRTATLYSFYGIMMSISVLAGGLYSSGKMLNALTGGELNLVSQELNLQVPEVKWDVENIEIQAGHRQLQGYELALLSITALFVSYGMAGGLAAAIITDFIQGLLTIAFSLLLLPWTYQQIGGFSNLRSHGELKEGMFDLFGRPEVAQIFGVEPLTLFYVVMLSLTGLIGVVVQPQVMSLCGAGKTEIEARFGFTCGHLLKRFCTIAWTFTGLACIIWYLSPELSPLDSKTRGQLTPDTALSSLSPTPVPGAEKVPFNEETNREFADELFGRAAHDLLPNIAPGLLGLMLVSALALTMSTADTQMIVATGLFTENLYKRFLAPNRSEAHYVRAGRLSSLLIVASALILQTTFSDVIDALKFIIKMTAPIGISFWFGILWRGWTPIAVCLSSLVAYVVWIFCAYSPHLIQQMGFGNPILVTVGTHLRVADSWTILFYLTAGVVSGILISWATPRTPHQKLDDFFLLIRTPVRKGNKSPRPAHYRPIHSSRSLN